MSKNFKKDFPIFENNPNLVFLDSSSTTMKTRKIVESEQKFYFHDCSNYSRCDYSICQNVIKVHNSLVNNLKEMISSKSIENIVITPGSTYSLNLAIQGLKNILNEGDEIITTHYEHSSAIVPIFELIKEKNIKVKLTPKDVKRVQPSDVEKLISPKTKIVSIIHVENLFGYENNVYEIGKMLSKKYPHIYFIVDGTQSIPHIKIDVEKMKCDLFAFTAHKMMGPTGIGCLYVSDKANKVIKPVMPGGHTVVDYRPNGKIQYKVNNERLVGGTLPIAQFYSFNEAIKYINSIGIENIHNIEQDLLKYAIKKLKSNKRVIIHNEDTDHAILVITIKNIFAQDAAQDLNEQGIAVRTGQACVKMSDKRVETKDIIRISFYIYNTKEDIDKLVNGINKIKDGLETFFKD